MHADGRPSGMAFVEFDCPQEAMRALVRFLKSALQLIACVLKCINTTFVGMHQHHSYGSSVDLSMMTNLQTIASLCCHKLVMARWRHIRDVSQTYMNAAQYIQA